MRNEETKQLAKNIYTEEYYQSNSRAKSMRGTMIMEDIINKDFEKAWEKNKPKTDVATQNTMKEMVAKIFGKETSEDNEIVEFYEDVQRIAIKEHTVEKFSLNSASVGLLLGFAIGLFIGVTFA